MKAKKGQNQEFTRRNEKTSFIHAFPPSHFNLPSATNKKFHKIVEINKKLNKGEMQSHHMEQGKELQRQSNYNCN